MWYPYVDDTMTHEYVHEYAVRSFSEHLSSIDQHFQFTSEEEKNGIILFLDTCLHVNQDGSTKVTVYRKPTHTDHYLNFHSNHHLQHKRAVVNNLLLRAKTLVSEEDDRVQEIQHVKQALKANNYPDWMLTMPNTESNMFKRCTREAIEIRLRKPSVNRDNGFELANVYNTILGPLKPL